MTTYSAYIRDGVRIHALNRGFSGSGKTAGVVESMGCREAMSSSPLRRALPPLKFFSEFSSKKMQNSVYYCCEELLVARNWDHQQLRGYFSALAAILHRDAQGCL